MTSNTYYDWLIDPVCSLVPAQAYIGEFLATFAEYPQRQKAAGHQPRRRVPQVAGGHTQVTQPGRTAVECRPR
jgi:hypothetical protein